MVSQREIGDGRGMYDSLLKITYKLTLIKKFALIINKYLYYLKLIHTKVLFDTSKEMAWPQVSEVLLS